MAQPLLKVIFLCSTLRSYQIHLEKCFYFMFVNVLEKSVKETAGVDKEEQPTKRRRKNRKVSCFILSARIL